MHQAIHLYICASRRPSELVCTSMTVDHPVPSPPISLAHFGEGNCWRALESCHQRRCMPSMACSTVILAHASAATVRSCDDRLVQITGTTYTACCAIQACKLNRYISTRSYTQHASKPSDIDPKESAARVRGLRLRVASLLPANQ